MKRSKKISDIRLWPLSSSVERQTGRCYGELPELYFRIEVREELSSEVRYELGTE